MAKLKAFSLVESIVSLMLVMLSIGMAFVIFMQVSKPQLQNADAFFIVENELQVLAKSKDSITNYTKEIDRFNLEIEVYETDSPHLIEVVVLLKNESGENEVETRKYFIQR